MKIERYSPGGYGAMCKDDSGDYLRISDLLGDGEELREAKVYIARIEEENTVLRQRVHDLALKVVALEMEAANDK